MGIVPPCLDGALVSSDFPLFNLDPQSIEPSFLGWLCRTRDFVELCMRASEGTTNRVRLKGKRFLALEIPLPPLEEQRRIVARIEELAAQIAEARSLRHQATAEISALWEKSNGLRFDGEHSRGWKCGKISEICEAIIDYRGRTPPITEEGIPHITSANIRNGRIDWRTSKFVTDATYSAFMTRGIPRPQDVLFTMEAPLGEVGVVPDARKFSLAQRVILLRPNQDIVTGDFLAKSLASPNVRRDISSRATSTTVSGIAAKRLKEVAIRIPPLAEQRRIVAYLDGFQAQVDVLKRLQAETAAELDALLPAILDRAFKGGL
jgi:type I restriction enzyme S subunit